MKEYAKTKKDTAASGPATQPARLDEAITRAFRKCQQLFLQNWKYLVAVAVLVLAAVAVYQIVDIMAEGREASYFEEFDRVTADLEPSQPAPVERLEALLGEARGAKAEKPLFKLVVEHLLEGVERIDNEARGVLETGGLAGSIASLNVGGTQGKEKKLDAAKEAERGRLLDAAKRLAAQARERFGSAAEGSASATGRAGTDEFSQWALNVERWVESARTPVTSFGKRRFVLPPVEQLPAPPATSPLPGIEAPKDPDSNPAPSAVPDPAPSPVPAPVPAPDPPRREGAN